MTHLSSFYAPLVVLALAGCNEYSLGTVKSADTADTGEFNPDVEITEDGHECVDLEAVSWDVDVSCFLSGAGPFVGMPASGGGSATTISVTHVEVTNGDTGTAFPSGTTEVTAGRYEVDDNVLRESDYGYASGVPGAWGVNLSGPEVSALSAVPADAEWQPFVVIYDELADEAVCDEYLPVRVCFDWSSTVAHRDIPDDAECEAGAGRFLLYPVQIFDNDQDGQVSVIFQPIQVTGSGALTEAAWITAVEPVEVQEAALRVMKVGHPLAVGFNDYLQDAGTVSVQVQAQGSSFNTGVITGGTGFYVQEVGGDLAAEFTVDLEWSCGSGTTVTPQKGYMFDSSSFEDCSWAVPQKFVLRPRMVDGVPVSVRLMPYGNLGAWITVPVVKVGSVYTWEYSFLDFHAEGTIDGWSAEDIDITLVDLSWSNIEVCDPGSYSLPESE